MLIIKNMSASRDMLKKFCKELRFTDRISSIKESNKSSDNNNNNNNNNDEKLSKLKILGLLACGCGFSSYCFNVFYKNLTVLEAFVNELKPASYSWDFNGLIKSFDHRSLRRGWEVYKTICSECHSLKYVSFRELVGVTHTEEEVKNIAAAVQVEDGPDETGKMYMRSGKLSDKIPSPFPNEESARSENNGALPVDLTYITNARQDGQNYVFSLLTSWMDPPAGINLQDGQSFNAYFPGGAIGMGQIIDDGAVNFSDGTHASQSQIAKDVVSFLTWTANPEFDKRKIWLIKSVGIFIIIVTSIFCLTKNKFSSIKSRKIFYVPKSEKKL